MPARRNYKKKAKPRYNRNKWKPKMSNQLKPDYSTICYTGDQTIGSGNPAGSEYNNVLTFQFANITNSTFYARLWDQYRINYVKVHFTPVNTQSVERPYDDETEGKVELQIPFLYAVIDRDDSNVQNSAEIKSRQGHRSVIATKPMTWGFSPSTLSPVWTGNVSAFGYKVNLNKQWLDMGNTGVIHFGLKFALGAAKPANAYLYNIKVTYYVSFRKRIN